ncbi:MAG: phosphatase PAP2 family protein [Stenotrophobium sp.]
MSSSGKLSLQRLDPSWLFVVAIGAVDIVLLVFTDFRVGLHGELLVFAAGVFLLSLWIVYGRLRPVPRLAGLARTALLFVLYTNGASILSYLLTGLVGGPLIDRQLAAIDRACGLDWVAWHHVFLSSPTLARASHWIYASLGVMLILQILTLDIIGRPDRARELFLGFAGTSLAVLVLGALLPAAGAFVYYDVPEALTEPYVLQFLRVHGGQLRAIDLRTMQGIVQFPSFHAALAVICVYVLRGIAWLFWPALMLNVLVVLVTPVGGGHHFVDVASGLAVAGAIIAVMIVNNRHRALENLRLVSLHRI